jgi:hypothetical protein
MVFPTQIENKQFFLSKRLQEPLGEFAANTTVASATERGKLIPIITGFIDIDRAVR